jgi:hypothetical protein
MRSSLGEHRGDEASNPVGDGNMAWTPFELVSFGALVGLMPIGGEVVCGIVGRPAEGYDVGRRSRVAGFSRAFSHARLVAVMREIRAAGAAGKRAAG